MSFRRTFRRWNDRTARLAVVLATLFVFSWQSYVTQTHVHFEPGEFAQLHAAKAVAQAAAGQQPSHRPNVPDNPANCPICQQIFLSGHYVSPIAIVFAQPGPIGAWLFENARTLLLCAKPSHNWRSRAPPRHSQA